MPPSRRSRLPPARPGGASRASRAASPPPRGGRPTPRIERAAEYAGTFLAPGGRRLTFTAQGDRLELAAEGKGWPLSRQGTDIFLAEHPDFALFPFVFGRQNGAVVEVSHGGDGYRSPAWSGRETPTPPASWRGFTGHYRANNPWATNFRVVLLWGDLWRIAPSGGRQRLVPAGEGRFRAADPDEPEELVFSDAVNGRALKVLWNGMAYFRDETP